MINLAIVISVSKYNVGSGFNNLNYVENDNEYITNIINKSNKYSLVFNINKRCKSSGFRSRLNELLNNYKDKEINEFLVYFSGHGYSTGKDFYLCCSDSDIDNISSTAISSCEIDDVARKLGVKKYVKIIDACNSGTSYIKGLALQNSDTNFINSTDGLKECYFLCSCDEKQESSIDSNNGRVSKFTLSIIKSLYDHFISRREKALSFTVLQFKVEELFRDDIYQTPKMILQGESGCLFLEKNDELENYLKSIKNEIFYKDNVKKETQVVTELEAISFAERFVSDLESSLSNKKNQGDVVSTLNYKLGKLYLSPIEIYESIKIGQWIEDNKNKKYIFAQPHYYKQYMGSPFTQLADSISGNSKNYTMVLDSFILNVNEDKSCIDFSLYSENDGLPKFSIQVVLLFNINKLYVLYNFLCAFPKNWKEYNSFVSNGKVGILAIKLLSDDLDKYVKQLATEFSDYTNSILNKYISELELD